MFREIWRCILRNSLLFSYHKLGVRCFELTLFSCSFDLRDLNLKEHSNAWGRTNRFGRHMQIAFGELLAFWFLFSRRKSVYLLEIVLSVIRYKSCLETKLSRRGNPWIFLAMWLRSSQQHTGHQEFFICEKFPLLLYLLVSVFSWYFKIVWPQVCFR